MAGKLKKAFAKIKKIWRKEMSIEDKMVRAYVELIETLNIDGHPDAAIALSKHLLRATSSELCGRINRSFIRIKHPYNTEWLDIDNAMCWADTPEGHGFWRDVHDSTGIRVYLD